MTTGTELPALIQGFFTDRLMRQMQASPNTVASYRDTFRMLLGFAQQRLKKSPSTLAMADLDAPFLGAFLEHLEKERGNSVRTRNARLAAVHSFFRYAAFHDPAHSFLIQRVLSMPRKRYESRPIEFLTRPEIEALLAAPDQDTWGGRRDRTLLLLAVQTGLRVSELVALRCQDVMLGVGPHVRCQGKGRKERCVPLRQDAVAALRSWLPGRDAAESDILFPNARGGRLSRDGVGYLLAKHLATARKKCPSLRQKHVSPHGLRHSAAMDLLLHGVDRTVIALWLGHEGLDSVQVYLHANMELKERALAKTTPYSGRPGRYRPDDALMAFLQGL
jgi:integrase/recombinase XerD